MDTVGLTGVLKWDVPSLSSSMHLSQEDVVKYFTDGRRVSFLLERRICNEVLGGTLPESEGASFDLTDREGHKWEVRSVTSKGTYFCPSFMIGSGRSFDEDGFLTKLEEVKGYILADITTFPNVEYWSVDSYKVIEMYLNGDTSKESKISRDKVMKLTRPASGWIQEDLVAG